MQDYRQRRAAQERDKQASATADFYALFDGQGLLMGELPPGVDLDKLDTLLQQLGPELAQELGLRCVFVCVGGCLVGLGSVFWKGVLQGARGEAAAAAGA
jgi:hypothetical protein